MKHPPPTRTPFKGSTRSATGRIAYFLPFHTLLYAICDSTTILFQGSADVDPYTRLPSRVEVPKTDWFDPDKPAKPDPLTDWLIEIYDGRFVGGIYNGKDGRPFKPNWHIEAFAGGSTPPYSINLRMGLSVGVSRFHIWLVLFLHGLTFSRRASRCRSSSSTA